MLTKNDNSICQIKSIIQVCWNFLHNSAIFELPKFSFSSHLNFSKHWTNHNSAPKNASRRIQIKIFSSVSFKKNQDNRNWSELYISDWGNSNIPGVGRTIIKTISERTPAAAPHGVPDPVLRVFSITESVSISSIFANSCRPQPYFCSWEPV